MSVRQITLLVIAVVGLPLQAVGDTIHVPGDVATIAEGISQASTGDTVIVACGEYFESGLVLGPGICLQGETGDASCVTINARGYGRVLLCVNADSTTCVSGLTIAGGSVGNANGGGMLCSVSRLSLTDVAFVGNACNYNGGGLCCEGGSVVALSNVVFSLNSAGMGGGLCASGLSLLSLRNVTFEQNSAAPGAHGRAGGMCCWGGVSPTLEDVGFIGNASAYGGALYCYQESHPALVRCLFEGNAATSDGGAVWCDLLSCPTFESTIFRSNHAGYYGGGIHYTNSSPGFSEVVFDLNTATMGGAVFCLGGATGDFDRVVFSRNEAVHHGGAIYCDASYLSISRTTIAANIADYYGGGVYCRNGSTADIENTIVGFNLGAPNEAAVSCGAASCVTTSCSDIFGNAYGDWVGCLAGQDSTSGNFSGDPMFCDAAAGDFTVDELSPCNGPNSPTCGHIGALDAGCAGVLVEERSWGAIKTMYR
ncbi:MAG: hypothetical protein KAW67_10770 [Candidatus Eisenbacteria sp.]|nr:hypothetical protein [Candidatus Eisenbacteria bacterium]